MSARYDSRRTRPVWLVALAAALGGCSGTADGGGGDDPAQPNANPYGAGTRVSEVVGPATWHNLNDPNSELCTGIPAEREVGFSGLTVSAVDRYDETNEGALGNLYAQDTPVPGQVAPPYSGMTIYEPGFSPPDLRVIENDVVDAFGILTEFVGPSTGNFPCCRTLPEVGGSVRFRFERGNLQPVVIPVRDLASYDTARQWLGVLVRIENVRQSEDPRLSSGRYTVNLDVGGGVSQADVPSISNELFDLQGSGIPFVEDVQNGEGLAMSSVTGVVTYFYAFHIAPRSAADIVWQ